ncbi:hypothetical protein EVAR_63595_1 [Eumeta japonica]|uniref:Uncharacterized protein n=1 Tax=Eumeta variegata TaxID=151549 RepID=A0A4C1ZMK6_EUMVA|nr:hypothetical protein EVAR_63595_1 [Eumeta japonica]
MGDDARARRSGQSKLRAGGGAPRPPSRDFPSLRRSRRACKRDTISPYDSHFLSRLPLRAGIGSDDGTRTGIGSAIDRCKSYVFCYRLRACLLSQRTRLGGAGGAVVYRAWDGNRMNSPRPPPDPTATAELCIEIFSPRYPRNLRRTPRLSLSSRSGGAPAPVLEIFHLSGHERVGWDYSATYIRHLGTPEEQNNGPGAIPSYKRPKTYAGCPRRLYVGHGSRPISSSGIISVLKINVCHLFRTNRNRDWSGIKIQSEMKNRIENGANIRPERKLRTGLRS